MATEQMTQKEFIHLYQKWCSQKLTEVEWHKFQQAITNPEMKSMLSAAVQQDLRVPEFDNLLSAEEHQEAYRQLMEQVNASRTNVGVPAHRIRFLKTTWFRYAAAIIVCFGIGGFFWLRNTRSNELTTTNGNKSLQTDVAPGGEKAILTLADGRTIALDSVANGQLANQGGVNIVKLANGQLAYGLRDPNAKEVMWNTLRTPKGGQYQITLPDGTRVWLNASSSIVFPTAFNEVKREVKIEGEIYFEVAKNKQKPFIVDVDGKVAVQVLGTSFNINSYADEESIKTSLLEGSVKVIKNNKDIVLKPGHQAVVASSDQQPGDKNNEIQIQTVDLDQVLAWKNGIFNFNGADLKTVMRQLERWYDIKVQYKGSISNELFKGKMYRNVNLSDVLEMLRKMDVQFKLEGKNLIVY